MSKFIVGQEVWVTDGDPHQKATVEKVSTWGEVNGVTMDNSPCYQVRCSKWLYPNRWIAEGNLAPA